MPATAQTIKSVFLAALDKSAPERAAYLTEACGADTELRDRVEELLRAHESGSFPDFLAEAAPAFDATLSIATTPMDATRTRLGDEEQTASLPFLLPPREAGHLGRLDHYEVHSIIGQGGMGVVLRAFDESLDRIVAIKVLGAQYAANGTARKRFIREAKNVAAVVHDHVVSIHAVDERVPYLVMQLVQGISLQERIDKTGPMQVNEILRIGMQIASGLAAAHRSGVVHRDIKPSNILLENGLERVKITDFGLARAVDDASVTQSGVIAGTPMYMSPEQARGEPVDPRSDLFSLGSVLYAMCTGHAPFRASGTMAVMKRVIEDSPRSICEANIDIPDWLEAIVFKLLEKHPSERFQSANEVAQLLEEHLRHLQHPSTTAMPAPVARRTKPRAPERGSTGRPARRSKGAIVLLVVAISLAVLILPALLCAGVFFYGWTSVDMQPSNDFQTDGRSIGPAGAGMGIVAPGPERDGAADHDRVQGKWQAVSGWFDGQPLSETQLKSCVATFTGSRVRVGLPPKGPIGEGSFALNSATTPRQITVKPTQVGEQSMEGIYRFDGNQLVLCLAGGLDPRPTEFVSRRDSSYAVLVLERSSADEDRLQGTWKAVQAEYAGSVSTAEALKQVSVTFAGERMSVTFGDGTKGEGTFTINPTTDPKQITVKAITENNQAMEGIFRFEGERLNLCIAGAADSRPKEFASKSGSKTFRVTLEREPAVAKNTPFELTPPKVLEHMLGSWSIEVTQKIEQGASTKHVGQVLIEPIAGGRFTIMRTLTDNGGPDELQLLEFDRDSWEIRGMYFDATGSVRGPSVGRFNAVTRTLTSVSQPEEGVVRVRNTRFPDADTIEFDVAFIDKSGRTLFDRRATLKRLKGHVGIAENETPEVSKEMSLLDRLVGTWDVDMSSRIRPGDKWKTEMTGRKVLGGRFIEVRERILPSGEENYTLFSFDVQKGVYRQWYVSSRWPQAEGTGTRDEAGMTWACVGGAGTDSPITTSLVWKFVSADKTAFRVIVTDRKKETLEDVEGSQVRRPVKK